MGNQLSGIAPAQILGVDSYFNDLPEFQFQASLGSTRFLKVARAKHKEGYVVIKVFVIQDLSLPLKSYQDQILSITQTTSNIPNVLPFQRAIIAERAGLMIRQYVHDNLYDRISTRPFLNLVEKKWIIFQLLSALEQAHNVKVCHGDIKTENVLVTSWNWVFLADLASFKPVYLPVDNPADFNYFFDTSRRRTCHIAPERFVDASSRFTESTSSSVGNGEQRRGASPNLPLLDLPGSGQGELKPSMDIFSAGCVIAELFLEGAPLFDLSQLLAYRIGEFSPEGKLAKIDNNIRSMVQHMVAKNPNERLSAKEYMDLYRGHVFPEEFFTFLKTYLAKFAVKPVMTSDEKIMRIYHDLNQIKQALLPENGEDEKLQLPDADNCFVMVVSLVTSCIRSLKFSQSKLTALDLMVELSQHLGDDVILERLLPYMFHLVNDSIPRVRAQAIEAITKCLAEVKNVPRSEGNVFPEYILLNLSHLANDAEVIVQVAFAENIASLAETALRFLETIQISNLNAVNHEKETQLQYQGSYDVELLALRDLIQNKVVTLLTNSDNIVKRTLLGKGLSRLCVFFGRQKANDVLLSHMITFLNDKQDWHLRGAFFDNVVGVAAYVGFQSLSILKPLLQQGLKDTEEFVVCKAIGSLTCLAELGLLQKPILMDFVRDVTPFLCHPNVWIRYAAVGYVCVCAKILGIADIYCFLMPIVKPALKQPVIQLESESIVLSVLQDPIPRAVFDYLVKSSHTSQIFKRLENNVSSLEVSGEDNIAQIFRKLRTQGMTLAVEKKLLRLKEVILKLNSSRSSERSKAGDLSQVGVLELTSLSVTPTMRVVDLEKMSSAKGSGNQTSSLKRGTTVKKREDQVAAGTKPKAASLPDDAKSEDEDKGSSSLVSSQEQGSKRKESQLSENNDQSEQVDTAVPKTEPQPEKLGIPSLTLSPSQTLSDQPKFAKCKMELRSLAIHKWGQYVADVKAKSLVGALIESKGKQPSWRPKGQLVVHLQEHTAAVNRLVVSHDSAFFASASNDSTVRIWETQRLETKSLTMRSRLTYSKQVGKINCLAFCENSHTLACSSDDASIHVFRIEQLGLQRTSPKLSLLVEKRLNVKEDGIAVDMHQFDTASQKIISYATVYGYIYGWDLRIPKEKYAWKLKNDGRLGLITSFAVDPYQCWLGCGTSDGGIVCWDMRFQIPISQIQHPKKSRVRRIVSHPLAQSWIASSFQGNNEVTTWDVETLERRQTLWASSNPPLSYTKRSNDTVMAMYMSDQESRPFLVTGGSDRRIRLWDLRQSDNSSIVAGSATDHLDHISLNYTSRVIDGSEVIYENFETARHRPSHFDESPRRGSDEPPAGHHDCIMDIAVTKVPQNFIISASSDGVIKVWK